MQYVGAGRLHFPPENIFHRQPSGEVFDEIYLYIFFECVVRKYCFPVCRKLARQQGLPWCEFWEFLNCSCDLASNEGRRVLEDYLQLTWNTSASSARAQSRSNLSSPTLCNGDRDLEAEKEVKEEEEALDQVLSDMMDSKMSLQTSTECSTPSPQIEKGQVITGSFLTGLVSGFCDSWCVCVCVCVCVCGGRQK